MSLRKAPVVKTQMLIRKPAAEVFEAFVNPSITTRFWYTKSSGRMEPGKVLRWDWEMYGVHAQVSVKAVEPNKRILIEWRDPPLPVEWVFDPRPDGTAVTLTNWGFQGSDDEAVAHAIDSMQGFSLLLAGAKAWLEHGIELNLTGDCHPDARR